MSQPTRHLLKAACPRDQSDRVEFEFPHSQIGLHVVGLPGGSSCQAGGTASASGIIRRPRRSLVSSTPPRRVGRAAPSAGLEAAGTGMAESALIKDDKPQHDATASRYLGVMNEVGRRDIGAALDRRLTDRLPSPIKASSALPPQRAQHSEDRS
jgi:hypothetical protein